jgi:hypothetical protein
MTTLTLPPPATGAKSHTAVAITSQYATAAAMRPGDTFTIDGPTDSEFVSMVATEDRDGTHKVRLSVHRDGIPALIAELQRLTL